MRVGRSSMVMAADGENGSGGRKGSAGLLRGWRKGRRTSQEPAFPVDYWQASQTSGLVGALGAFGLGVKLVSLETVAWRMRVAGRERR